MAEETRIKSLADLHSAIADFAAHYIPKHELRDYFTKEELRGIQKKPSYKITDDHRGVIEKVLVQILDRKTKTVKKKGKKREVKASASESIVQAARDNLPTMLRNDADNYENLVHLHPVKIRRFITGTKDIVLEYLENNQKRLQKYGVDDAITAVKKLDKGLENRVIGACKKEIRHLESELRAEAREAGYAWRQVGTLERKNDRLERQKERLKKKKEELEQAVVQLAAGQETSVPEAAEPQTVVVQPSAEYAALAQENQDLRKRLQTVAARLRSRITANKQERSSLQAQLKEKDKLYSSEIVRLNHMLVDAEEAKELLEGELEKVNSQLDKYELEIENLCEGVARTEREADEKVQAAEEKYEQEKTARERYEEAFTVLNARYQARFAELGTVVAEWYAFTESAFAQNADFNDNEQLQELRSRGKKLAVLVSDLIEEAKCGSRAGQDRKGITAPWKEQEDAPLPTLEDEDNRYKQMLDEVKSEHQKEIWGWMHALYQENASYELRQGVYERFLSTEPKDNMIKFAVHNNLGNIFYKHRADYASASRHYHEAETALQKEREQNPGNKDIRGKLAEVEHNLNLCEQRLAA